MINRGFYECRTLLYQKNKKNHVMPNLFHPLERNADGTESKIRV